ncbi:MAG: hypothetical protein K9N55_07165 [Phycisphaerae bacterium]|nr:hypothetical protein [Phycisphaerae bacterium]
MNDPSHIQKQVDETMALLEQPESIKAGPWFRSHVHNRLRKIQEPSRVKGPWIPLLRPGLLMVVIFLNLVTFFITLTPSDAAQESRATYLSTMASEYQLSVSSELFETYDTGAEE